MKQYIILVLLLLFVGGMASAAEPPELEEWFYIEGDLSGPKGNLFSYLPDFDTVGGRQGKNATAVSTYPWMPTWYNRYAGDTEDQYSWGYQIRDMKKADLNDDGIADYITRTGRVHRGGGHGIPPEAEYTNYSQVVSSVLPFDFHDIDNDGYIDAIANPGYFAKPWLLAILWGGPDLTKLRTQVVYRRPYEQAKTTEFLAGVLPQKSPSVNVRIITRSYEESGFQQAKWISYVLREMKAIHEADSVRFEFTTLDSISDAGLRPAAAYDLFGGSLHQSRINYPVFFLNPVGGRNAIEIYNLSNGVFDKVQEFSTGTYLKFPSYTVKSINGDEYADWHTATTYQGRTQYVFYAGQRGGLLDTLPFAKITFKCPLGESISASGIGDVTGDNIGDFAIALNNDVGCFTIYKGIASHTVGVPEPGPGFHRSFDMQQNYPNPVGTDRRTTLRFSSDKPQHLVFALYTLDGRLISELSAGYVPQGTHELPVDLTAYRLPPGMYLLRLSNGEAVRERAILLQ